VRIERSGDGGVVQIEQRFRDGGIVCGERERPSQNAVLA
jgi:hypothetical protein